MLNPNEIDPKHLLPIQAAIMKHRSRLDEHRVAQLYQMARTALRGSQTAAGSQDPKTLLTRAISSTGGVSVTCTDADSGLFVQLSEDAGASSEKKGGALLTFGQKFCQENRDTMWQNIATKIW